MNVLATLVSSDQSAPSIAAAISTAHALLGSARAILAKTTPKDSNANAAGKASLATLLMAQRAHPALVMAMEPATPSQALALVTQ
jgi:hypothetical protein